MTSYLVDQLEWPIVSNQLALGRDINCNHSFTDQYSYSSRSHSTYFALSTLSSRTSTQYYFTLPTHSFVQTLFITNSITWLPRFSTTNSNSNRNIHTQDHRARRRTERHRGKFSSSKLPWGENIDQYFEFGLIRRHLRGRGRHLNISSGSVEPQLWTCNNTNCCIYLA